MKETVACGSGDTKNLKPAVDLPTLKKSSIFQDLNNVTEQETNSMPIGNTSEINCSQTKSFQPPTSLAIKFAKRVAICTAVVALAKYAYPRLMVTSNAKLTFLYSIQLKKKATHLDHTVLNFTLIFQKLVEEPEIAVAEDGLYHLGEKSFAKHVEKGSHLVKFYAPWCGHCKVIIHFNRLSLRYYDC